MGDVPKMAIGMEIYHHGPTEFLDTCSSKPAFKELFLSHHIWHKVQGSPVNPAASRSDSKRHFHSRNSGAL